MPATTINDLVLIHMEDKPLTYARIEDINPDVKRGWYQVKLLILQIPLQVVVWILRDVYIDGETFTMGGKPMRLEKVIVPPDAQPEQPEPPKTRTVTEGKKVISLADLKKKK